MKNLLLLPLVFLFSISLSAQHATAEHGKTYYDKEQKKVKEVFAFVEKHSFDPDQPSKMTTRRVKHGAYFLYREDGTLEAEGFMDNEAKDGEWKFYDTSGKLIRTERWNKGEKVE
jgi:antitoxin component YwqK of YwqJK toxin-antitoxin module